MPTYTFRHKETSEILEHVCKIGEREQWLKDNPEYEQVHTTMAALGDPVRLGITKPPSDFQTQVIGRIRDNYPGATALKNTKFGIPREH